jgi:hypothetical protein
MHKTPIEPKLEFQNLSVADQSAKTVLEMGIPGAEGGLELNSITLITRNFLLIVYPAQGPNAPQSRFHCTFIVRRTHCEEENRAEALSLNSPTNSLTSGLPIGQG